MTAERHSKKRKIQFLIGFIIIFFAGFFAGTTVGIKQLVSAESGDVEISKVVNLYAKTRSSEVSFDRFWDVWDRVKENHVSQTVDEVDLFYGSISGMVRGLGDPYSVFFPPVEAKEFADDLSGEFEGIGAEIGLRKDQLTVIAPLPGSPAEQAGLEAGDKIFAINGEETSDMTLDQAVLNIRGPKGSVVTLTVSHNGFETVEDIDIIRDTINLPTVIWEMKENNIAYMRISYFNESTWDEFDTAIGELLAASPDALILDLRRNPGGFLDTSIAVASEWVESGVIVREWYSEEKSREYETNGKHRLAGIRTAVLVDGGTASGSEIVAGALQDYGLATLIGSQTFGKGSVQDFNIFPDGSALKLTIARWLTPNSRQIDGEGIVPDIIVEEMFGEEGDTEENKTVVDYGMKKAIEVLTQ
jgi:carboxyl-terminal processing protease